MNNLIFNVTEITSKTNSTIVKIAKGTGTKNQLNACWSNR